MEGVRARAAWGSASGPLLPLNVRFAGEDWRGKGTSGQAASLHWGGLRAAKTSLRCSISWPRRRTHFAHCVRCVRTSATSQLTIRASCGATSPGLAGRAGPVGPAVRKAQAVHRTACLRVHLLGTPEALRVLPERAFGGTRALFATRTTSVAARRAVPGGGDFCGDEKRRPGVGVRSTLRCLTRRSCLNGVSAANAVSSATRPQGEHRSGVFAARRPPQHELPPGTACRAALKPRESGHRATAATGRKRILTGPCCEGAHVATGCPQSPGPCVRRTSQVSRCTTVGY